MEASLKQFAVLDKIITFAVHINDINLKNYMSIHHLSFIFEFMWFIYFPAHIFYCSPDIEHKHGR